MKLNFSTLLFLPSIVNATFCTVPAPSANSTNSSPTIAKIFRECAQDSTITFSPNVTYNLGSVLSLGPLKNVTIELFGKLQYSDDMRYWILNSIYQPFQNVSVGLDIGGSDITIDGGNTGVIDGQGQVWYDMTNSFSQYYGRPVPLRLNQATNVVAKDFTIRQAQYWSFVVYNSSNVHIENVKVNNTSITKPDEHPGNLVNTDGFDTLYSNNVTIKNVYVRNGDDCVAVKLNSTNILIDGMVCEGGGGLTIGSLGQYKGVFDLVENVTARNIVVNSPYSHGAWMKTWSGATSDYIYPPNGGGGGTGLIKNIRYENFTIFNSTGAPVYITQCNTYSQYSVPCREAPTSFRIENVTWDGFVVQGGNLSEPLVGLSCLSLDGCNGIAVKNITAVDRGNSTGALWKCEGVNGLEEGCESVLTD